MAVCNLLTGGIAKSCDNNIGGIKELYLVEKEYVSSTTLSSPGDVITTITMAAGKEFKKFEFNKNTSTFTEVTTFDPANGTELCTQTISLFLSRREKSKKDVLLLLSKGKELVAIIKDANDLYWYFGETNGLILTEKNSETGTARTDKNGYTLTFVGEEPEDANTVSSAAVAAVIE
jgi:hypothetical protein